MCAPRRHILLTAGLVDPVLLPSFLGLLVLGTGLDLLARGQAGALTWLAFWTLVAGLATTTWSATFAFLDWVFAPRADRAGCGFDGIALFTIVALYGLSALFRVDTRGHAPGGPAAALEVAAAALLAMRAWMGHELGGSARQRM
jgi:hypothetical protein